MGAGDGFEGALAATEDEVDAALKAAAAVTRELRKAKVGAARGQVRDLRRALAAAAAYAAESAQAAKVAEASFDFDDHAYLASGAFAQELVEVAAAADVTMVESDQRLLCYPSLIKVLPADAAVEIDRRRERRLRPSVLVALLAAAQKRPPRFRAETFLESLEAAYDLVRAKQDKRAGVVLPLVDLWAVLTLLPGQQREYTKPEFARDLYLLDASGASTAKSGRTLRWRASTGTRGTGTLVTVAQSGQQQLYWGVSFMDAA
ncbi:MAG: hypothetical protein ABI890_09765 [Lapillicoccus sp.]